MRRRPGEARRWRLPAALRRVPWWTSAPLLLLLGGCTGQQPTAGPVGQIVVATQVPTGRAGAEPEPSARYPAGSRLVRIDLDRPDLPPLQLSDGLAAAGGASVSPDGTRVLFVGQDRPGAPYSVWSCRLDGSDRRQVVGGAASCGAAAFLPDGRIVYSAATGEPAPLPELESGWALFVADGDGSPGARITFSGGLDLDPSLVADGRIVHASWQPGGEGRPDGGSLGLFTVHPDGTGFAPLHGQHDGERLKLRPRQAADGTLFFLARDRSGPARVRGTDWRAPREGGFEVPLPAGEATCVEPLSDSRLLVAFAAGVGSPGGLQVVDREGRALGGLHLTDPGWDVVHVARAAERPRPQGHLSSLKPELAHGNLLCIDARRPGQESATRVRIRVQRPPERAGAPRRVELLGEVPLAEDGSFFLRVPADVPLLVDLLDARGRVLRASRTPFWVRPNEQRGCVGCHEDADTTPPNRRPQSVLRDPVDLTGLRAQQVGQ